MEGLEKNVSNPLTVLLYTLKEITHAVTFAIFLRY